MVTTKSDTAIEGVAGADNQPTGVGFSDLSAWIIGQEEANKDLRAHKVFSTDANAPDSVRLTYSHPHVVNDGRDGYEDGYGRFVGYPV